jgi:selenocysteine lyase/cysteine desulfurase
VLHTGAAYVVACRMHNKIGRRRFLTAAAATGAVTLAGRVSAQAIAAAPPTSAASGTNGGNRSAIGDDWGAVRKMFRLDPAKIHLAGLLFASNPERVRSAIEKLRDEFDKNPVDAFHHNVAEREEAVFTSAEKYLGAGPNSVALTDSTTMGLGLVYSGLKLARGEDILTSTHDHYSTYEALRMGADRSGASVRKVALYDDGATAKSEEIVARLTKAVQPKTRYVALTWVHSSTGVKLPVADIARALADVNAKRSAAAHIKLCVDGVHGFGNQAVTAPALGCDIFIAGTHKWIWGPRGTGIVWASERGWASVQPAIPCFDFGAFMSFLSKGTIGDVKPARLMSPGGFKNFETRWALPEAFALHDEIGKERIEKRIATLAQQLKEGLAAMKHVSLHTPMDAQLAGPLVCFEVKGMKPEEVEKRLADKSIVASTTPYAQSFARFTPSAFNTPVEMDTALAAVRALA